MRLSDEQKQKYLTYLQAKGLPAPKPSASKDLPDDILDWMLQDILTQVKQTALYKSDPEFFDSNEFADKTKAYIIGEALKYALDESQAPVPDSFRKALKQVTDLYEALGMITMESAVNPPLAVAAFKGLCAAYFLKCLDLGIQADPMFVILMSYPS